MLYLMRKSGESIIINNNIEMKVIEVKGKSVKLGFEFPPEATVLRKELHDKILEENIAAAKSDTDVDTAALEAMMQIGKKNKSDEPEQDTGS